MPYTNDSFTLHLWHFDGPTNTISTTDAVPAGGITLTNVAQTNVPGTTIALGAPAYDPALGTCLEIMPTNESAGSAFALAQATNPAAGNGGFSTNDFCNTNTGAFTIEALVKPGGNPAIAGNGIWNVVSADNNGNNGLGRCWQFRIESATSPTLDYITDLGSNILLYQPSLPLTGPDAAVAGQWYHMAVTYTGGSPTNGDPPETLTFYWTLLNASRTNADVVPGGVFTSVPGMTGTPVPGVGGSARQDEGVADGQGFKGSIDEVRVSSVCRKSNEMAFGRVAVVAIPLFLQEPPTDTFIGFGQTLSLVALVTGSPTPSYTWKQGGTTLPSQTNSSLVISNADFTAGGTYQLFCTNSGGAATSVVCNVTIGAVFSQLFDTGVDNTGAVAAAGSTDLHYTLTQSADVNNLGPNAIVWNMTEYPLGEGDGTFSNPDGASAWIGPEANAYVSPVGAYIYHTTFVLDTVDVTQPLTLSGIWYVNEIGNDILLNGVSTGNTLSSADSGSGKFSGNFTMTNGFVQGLNTLDFLTARSADANSAYRESAVRVELSGIGLALPAGKPVITTQPQNVTLLESQGVASNSANFLVVAAGRPPLTYQWFGDGAAISPALAVPTNRTLTIVTPSIGGQPTNYTCVISNASGAVTSNPAKLTLVSSNLPPITPNYNYVIFSNATLAVDISTLLNNSSDPDGNPLTYAGNAAGSVQGGAITQAGVILTYAPPPGFLGLDSFDYLIIDSLGSYSSGTIFINVVAPPAFSPPVIAGSNVVLNGSGGIPNGTYHALTSTNVALPLSNWTSLPATNFDGSGNFRFTNAITPGNPRQFFRISVP